MAPTLTSRKTGQLWHENFHFPSSIYARQFHVNDSSRQPHLTKKQMSTNLLSLFFKPKNMSSWNNNISKKKKHLIKTHTERAEGMQSFSPSDTKRRDRRTRWSCVSSWRKWCCWETPRLLTDPFGFSFEWFLLFSLTLRHSTFCLALL